MEGQHVHEPNTGWSYTNFVRSNPTGARMIESLVQYVGFFVPNRLASRDLAIESGYAVASIVAVAHDRILVSQADERIQSRDRSGGLDDVKTRGAATRLNAPRRKKPPREAFAEQVRLALSMLAHIQIVAEKIARQHGGARRRRQVITFLETLKAVARLVLLATTREMIISGGQNVRATPDAVGKPDERSASVRRPTGRQDPSPKYPYRFLNSTSSAPRTREMYTGRRSGVRLAVPPTGAVTWGGTAGARRTPVPDGTPGSGASPAEEMGAYVCRGETAVLGARRTNGVGGVDACGMLKERGVTGANGSCPKDPHPGMRAAAYAGTGGDDEDPEGVSQALLLVGEVLNILRPLLYTLYCASAGEKSWRPWLTSLGVDALAFICTARAGGGSPALLVALGDGSKDGSPSVPVLPHLNEVQAAELRRRKLLWLMYLLRSPAFELVAEPVGRGTAGLFEGVPLLGGMTRYALSMLLYVQQHHFYISAS